MLVSRPVLSSCLPSDAESLAPSRPPRVAGLPLLSLSGCPRCSGAALGPTCEHTAACQLQRECGGRRAARPGFALTLF